MIAPGAAAILGLAVLATAGAAHAADPLQPYHWTSRVLVLFAPDPTDPAMQAQRRLLQDYPRGMQDRQLVVLALQLADQPALRQHFGIGDGFAAVLVGKDGGAKLRADRPIPLANLFACIDAMPMRQQEMRRPPD